MFRAILNRVFVLLVLLTALFLADYSELIQTKEALAGTGGTINVHPSRITPVVDGACDVAEYSDSDQTTMTVLGQTIPVFLKHGPEFVYVCFHQPPVPASIRARSAPEDVYIAVYVDRENNGGGGDTNDFLITVRANGSGAAAYYTPSTSSFRGSDPGGWSARSSRSDSPLTWHGAELQISRQTLGGWAREVGLSFAYWCLCPTGEEGNAWDLLGRWPANASSFNPSTWATANLRTAEISIGQSYNVPTIDGWCEENFGDEYADASIITFPARAGKIDAYLKHSLTDLYLCITFLDPPDATIGNTPAASLYISRSGIGGGTAGADEMVFSVDYYGNVAARRGGPGGFTGPDPGGYSVQRSVQYDEGGEEYWDAEFRISQTTLGGFWDRPIRLVLAEHWTPTDDTIGWPAAYAPGVPDTWATGRLTTQASTPGINLRPTAIEVTQSVQDLSNSVPLIAGKRTFARVYVDTDVKYCEEDCTAAVGLTARLHGFKDGVRLGIPLQPANRNGTINVPTWGSIRMMIDDAFLFELPASWIQEGSITLRAEINPFQDQQESDYVNNSISGGGFAFEKTNPLPVKLVDYQYNKAGARVSATSTDLDMLESLLRRMYPIAQLNSSRRSVLDGGLSDTPTSDHVNAGLKHYRDTYEAGDPKVIYYGLVSDSGGFMRGSAAGIPSWEAAGPAGSSSFGWDFDGSYADWYGAHEIGHTLGEPHAEFCGAEGGETYPYDGGIIGGPPGSARFMGFDAGDASVGLPVRIRDHTWTDIMTYCPREWVSDFRYNRLRTDVRTRLAEYPDQTRLVISKYLTGDFLSVYGVIDLAKQQVELPFVSRQPQVSRLPALIEGPYHIQLEDNTGKLLATYAFTPLVNSEDSSRGVIAQIVPFVEGTKRIAIYSRQAGRQIAAMAVSANAPKVSAVSQSGGTQQPAKGAINISWAASDPDGDRLSYTILYSADNRTTWRPLAIRVGQTAMTVDASQLEGSQERAAYLRVVANDGVLTAFADAGPFHVEGKAPQARITSPADGATYVYGQLVTLEGHGLDFEEGTLDGKHLTWTSDVDGALGGGRLNHIGLLSVGTHRITLEVKDSSGMVGAADVTIHVLAATSALGPILSTGPETLVFTIDPARATLISDVIAIRNAGSGSMEWFASSNVPWISVANQTGKGPAQVEVTIDPTLLRNRTAETGFITVSAPAASKDSRLIRVLVEDRAYIPSEPDPGSLASPKLVHSDEENAGRFSPRLTWENPPDVAQVHVRVWPFGNDGPGIDLIFGSAETTLAIPAPSPDTGPYIILPDMTYSWTVRTSGAGRPLGPEDLRWGPWAPPGSFRTPTILADGITPVSPTAGERVATLTPGLHWKDSEAAAFYYEVQLSQDSSFNTDPTTAAAPVYWNLVHGGMTEPRSSWAVPPEFALEPNSAYYWRVRPRIQGDGKPVTWSPISSFVTDTLGVRLKGEN